MTEQERNIDVFVPEGLRSGVYANTVNMNVTDSEVTINFVYVNDNDNPNGTLVSRVVVPRNMLGQLRDILVEAAEAVGGKK